jgi:single-strand DNA-binding protein
MVSPAAKARQPAHDAAARNDVVLVGRVSAEPSPRVLPSGDELLSWRLVVGRVTVGRVTVGRATGSPATGSRAAGSKPATTNAPTIDTIDCIAYKAAVRRLAARCVGGEILEVHGALRRRFWRGANGLASRYEVEVFAAKRLSPVTRRSETTA